MNYKISRKLADFLYKIYSNRWLKSIRYGLITIQPFILTCCLLLIILNTKSLIINNNIENSVLDIYYRIDSLSRIILLSSTCYYLAIYKNEKLDEKVNPFIVAIVGLISAMIMTSRDMNILNMYINARWVFSHILIAMTFSELFMYLYKVIKDKINFLDNVDDYILKQSINSILPTVIIISFIFLINTYVYRGMGISEQLEDMYINSINYYEDNNFFSQIKYLADVQVYWFLGGHGGDIINPMFFKKTYLNVFCNIGGSGSTICLIIAVLIYKSHRQSKEVAKLSILPSIFNVNEIIVYGLPIILNPIYIIPFILTPVVLGIVTNIALLIGFISIKDFNVSWQVPILINGYIATSSIKGVVLQLINIIIGILIYIPFVGISYNIQKREDYTSFNSLKELIFSKEAKQMYLIKRMDNVGQICNILANDLRESLLEEENIYLEYQPQVNKDGKVVGVESLFRWNHKNLGYIPPNIAITLAEETNLIKDLGKWIINKSIYQLSEWNTVLDNNIDMSINISSTQLEDPFLTSYIKYTLEKYKVSPNNLKLEITESLALGDDNITKTQLQELTNLGVKLVIDDFGVGYNPILYLKKYKIATMKIDGSLIKDIDVNEESRNIVKAIYGLCESFEIETVCEFVENYTQKSILDDMGNGIYQGYLFSKPLQEKECLEFILK